MKKGTYIEWTQSAPGRGIESKTIKRRGTILSVQGRLLLVRPDDDPNSAVLMQDPNHPAASQKKKPKKRKR